MRSASRSRGLRERGSIFIVALWFITLLSILAIGLAQTVRQKITEFQRLEKRRELRLAAESVVNRVVARMAELAAGGESIPLDKLAQFRADARGEMTFDGAKARYLITDETTKFNINYTDITVLTSFLSDKAGRYLNDNSATNLASAIIDFVDADDFILNDYDNGSEKFSYERAGLAYGPKNTAFEFIGEVRFVKGMTEEIFAAIEPYITVYGDGKVNLNFADEELMKTMGIYPDSAAKILELRRGVDGIEGTGDDEVFTNTQEVYDRLKSSFLLSEPEHQSLQAMTASNYFTFQPHCLKIVAEALLVNEKARSSVVCVLDLKNGFKYWAEV